MAQSGELLPNHPTHTPGTEAGRPQTRGQGGHVGEESVRGLEQGAGSSAASPPTRFVQRAGAPSKHLTPCPYLAFIKTGAAFASSLVGLANAIERQHHPSPVHGRWNEAH